MKSSALTRRRGRPKIVIEEKDYGTPELQLKRAVAETTEPLDLCLEKGLISHEQQWCGLHLRWLYSLRYGAPGLQALDLLHVDGIDIDTNDPELRQALEDEYNMAALELAKSGLLNLLLDICVHNQKPDFLKPTSRSFEEARASYKALTDFRDGLDILMVQFEKD